MMRNKSLVVFALILVVVGFASLAVAQDHYETEDGVTVSFSPDVLQSGESSINTPSGGPDTYGTSDFVIYNIAGVEFDPQWDSEYGHFTNGAIFERGTSSAKWFHASFHLPEGALLWGTTPFYYDTNDVQDVKVEIYHCAGALADSCTLLDTRETVGDSGWQDGYENLDVGFHTIDNWDNVAGYSSHYRVYLTLSGSTVSDTSLRMKSVTLWYLLQLSPAPVAATFSDVPVGAFGFQHVEALNASGITAGCGGGNFCPNDPLTRVQMAIFLAKALGLHHEY